MPRAPRDKENATPKKRVRKTTPTNGNGNGIHAGNGNGAVETPVTVAPEAPVVAAPATTNLEELIRIRAYELYVQSGGNGGSPLQDWLRAQQEICG